MKTSCLRLKLVELNLCGSNEGDCYQVYCTMCDADLYAPQGVDLGEGGSLSYWCDTEWWLALAAAIVKCS